MGMDSAALKMLERLGFGCITDLGVGFYRAPGRADSRKHIILIDGPSYLQRRSSSLMDGYALTVGQLVNQIQAKVQHYLLDSAVEAVLFLFDCGTPKNKTIFRKEKVGQTPETPFADRSMAATATLQQGMAAWAAKLLRDIVPFDDARADDLTMKIAASELDFQLPLDRKEVKSRQEANPAYVAYSYEDCLSNKAFKRLLYDIVARHLLRSLIVPDGKWALVRAPEYAELREGTEQKQPRAELLRQYEEADAILGYFAGLFLDHDVYVDSADGDAVSCLVLGSWARLRAATNDKEPLHAGSFVNNVYVLQNQWASNYGNRLVDINRLFVKANLLLSVYKRPEYGVHWKSPIVSLFAIIMMCGSNDYYNDRVMPDISTDTLFKTLLLHSSAFGNTFLQPHLDRESGYHHIVVNPDAFARLFVCCYRQRYNDTTLPVTDLKAALAELKKWDRAALRDKLPTEDQVYVAAANLSWALSYFSASSYRCKPPDPFEQYEGLSIWGYTLERSGPNEYGHAKAAQASKVHVKYLRWRSARPIPPVKPGPPPPAPAVTDLIPL